MKTATPLERRLGTGDAMVVGLCAMVGAGLFAAFAPAARAAGSALLVGLALAAVVAWCNASASAQLAAAYPSSGGTYVYGRKVLGPWWGFVAGWGFVVGKTASCAAMALTFAAYALPDGGWWSRALALSAVVVVSAVNLRGITRTAATARVLLAVVLGCVGLALLVVLRGRPALAVHPFADGHGGVRGVVQAAALLFFAFAGYARVATLGEEVRRPELIGRAVLGALAIVVGLYAVVGVTLLRALGPDALGASVSPVSDAVRAVGAQWAVPVVVVGAAAASLGSLLALLAGVGRTALAMAREGDLPRPLASVHPVHQVPDRAQLVVAAGVCALVLLVDLRGAIGFSSFGVLVYYAVANLSALRQPAPQRHWPRAVHVLGLLGCLGLVSALPPTSIWLGVVVLAVGVLGRLVLRGRPQG